MSGLWWRNATLPTYACGFELRGDPQALPKRGYPVVWRFQHTWAIFRVLDTRVPYYRVMFSGDGYIMRYRFKVRTPRFAVRVGQFATAYFAFAPDEAPLEIRPEKTGLNYERIKREVQKFRGGLAETDAITMI